MKRAERVLSEALLSQIFSGAQLWVRFRGEVVLHGAWGLASREPLGEPVKTDSLFDLASLTKPLATASAIAILCERGLIDLDDPIGRRLTELAAPWRDTVLIRHLLQHRSGLPAWKPYFERIAASPDPRAALIAAVAKEEIESAPGGPAVYSDLDFMLLGALVEAVAGRRLDAFVAEELYAPLAIADLLFLPIDDADNNRRIGARELVATENCPRRGLLRGRVHDDNAYAAGGVCGHAGLFGTAAAAGGILALWDEALKGQSPLISRRVAQEFVFPRHNPPRTAYVLGWDRPTWKTSQAGRFISPHAIGHLGFTGCSAWLDFDRELMVVFLTNRVHPTRREERLPAVRRALHEALYQALDLTAPGPYRTPPRPNNTHSIHLIGVAGTGMGALAGLLKQAGFEVSGSDQAVYPPMSTLLAEQGIAIRQPFAAENLTPAPSLTVVGNVCTRDHEEVVELRRRELPYDSLAGTFERYFLPGRRALVVAGTHGKTTTSAMLAWMLMHAGRDPGFLIGGKLLNFNSSFRLGGEGYFVVEGDEYDSAYFDKYPKFLHYRPFGAIMTSLEYDHADIYDSLEEIELQFARLAWLIPLEGRLIACADYETVRKAARHARCPVVTYGAAADARYRYADVREEGDTTYFTLLRDGAKLLELHLPMTGLHNVSNAVAGAALLLELGHPLAALAPALQGFLGVARRQQVAGTAAGVRVIDDFAHHPTAIRVTLDGLRRAYPAGRLLVAFDPRTNTTSRNIFQAELATCFTAAALVLIGNPSRMDTIPKEKRLDVEKLAADLRATGIEAAHIGDVEEMAARLAAAARPGDTVAILSNGSFGGLHPKVLARLKAKPGKD